MVDLGQAPVDESQMPLLVVDRGDAEEQRVEDARNGRGCYLRDEDEVRVFVGLALALEVKLTAFSVDFVGSAPHTAQCADANRQP